MRAVGIGLLVIGVLVAAVPAFNNCTYEGMSLTTVTGMSVNMKCFWTARASLVTGVTLGLVGLMMALSKKQETQRFLAILAAVLGAFTVSLPTALIGVCKMNAACVDIMKPTLIALGGLTIILAIVAFVLAGRNADEVTPTQGAAA